MLDTATDFHVIKRHWSIEFDGVIFTSSNAIDHFRLRVYELDNSGVETLVYESDVFFYFPQQLSFIDAPSIPATFEFAPTDGKFYRVEAVAFDTGESAEVIEDEWFMYARPDEIQTQAALVTTTGGPITNAIDQWAIDRLLMVLGADVLHGEFEDASGYTTKRVTRGYGLNSLTEERVTELLAASSEPGEQDVLFKAQTLLTTADNGNELSSLEQEQEIA